MANTAKQSYGGFWVRVLAYLVDSVILLTLFILLIAGAAFLGDFGAMVIGAVGILGPLLYWGILQASPRQATFGKSLLGLKVTDSDGERLSLVRSLVREIAKIVSGIPMGLGFLLAAFTGRKQALHDMLASTTVVRDSSGHVLAALVLPGQLQERTIALPGTLESLPARSGPKYNDLMSAVMSSDVAALNELLAMGKWPDKPDSHGMTPLTAAAMRGDQASVEVLVKAGADSDRALAVARMRRDAAMTSLLERYATSKRP